MPRYEELQTLYYFGPHVETNGSSPYMPPFCLSSDPEAGSRICTLIALLSTNTIG